jgi:excisionase family DNA binding protein
MCELYSILDTAPKLKIAEITLRRLIKKRAIPFHRIGHRYFFTEDDINEYLLKVSHPILPEKK